MTPRVVGTIAILIFTIAAVFGSGVLYLQFTCNGDGRESFGDKEEWSILQGLESSNREKPISKLEFQTVGKYQIVCVPLTSGERTWIMLNPKNPPFYKQLPTGQYSLTNGQYRQILNTGHVTSTVSECLSSHAQE